MRVLRLEVSVYNVTNQSVSTRFFSRGGGGVKSVRRQVTMNNKKEDSYNYLLTYDSFVPEYNRFHRGKWITRASGGEGVLDTHGPLGPGVSRAPSPALAQVIHSPL